MNGPSQIFASLAALTLPAASLTLYSIISGDPSYRPLGVTIEAMELFSQSRETSAVAVHVDWGRDRTSPLTHDDLRVFIDDAISRRTSDYFIKFHDVPGRSIDITVKVGASYFGPFPPGRLVEAIRPLTLALQEQRHFTR